MTGHRAKIRMYRHGLGDCLLVRLARDGQRDFNILIDCGVILGTTDAKAKINRVMDDVIAETGGEVDLIVVTHAHGDHVSGFLQAEAKFRSLKVGEVWMAWTEDPKDAFAQSLLPAKYRQQAADALQAVAGEMQAAGDLGVGERISGLMDFFGIDDLPFGAAGARATTEDAVQVARSLVTADKLRYCEPGQKPFRPDGAKARIMVLGPPRDAKLIRKSSPSKSTPETYEMALDGVGPILTDEADEEDGRPFSSLFTIPTEAARTMPFFMERYWTEAVEDDWRGIDDVGTSALDFALKLDSDTNNTSLVLAIELDGDSPSGKAGRDVLLFAADAQIGNWQSWRDVKWTKPEGEERVDGLDLVKRTLVYKVGHHGSHNATLKAYLESMERLLVALNPVDEVMAGKKRWDHIPLPSLEAALRKQASEALARADQDGAAGTHVHEDPLFYEVTV